MWVVLSEREGESKEAYQARVTPGRGRYRLEHWSLVLEYGDGARQSGELRGWEPRSTDQMSDPERLPD